MADNLGVTILASVDIKSAEAQLDALIAKYNGTNINIGINTNTLKAASTQVDNLNKSLGNLGNSGSNSGLKQLETQMKAINNFDWNNLKSQLVAQQNEVKSNNLEWKQLEIQMKQSNNVDWSNLNVGLVSQRSEVAANNLEWEQLETQMKAINNFDWNNLKSQLQGQKSEVVANNAEWKKLEAELVKLNNFDFNIGKGALKDSESLTKLQNQAQTLQNTMAKLGSSSDTSLVFKKNPDIASNFTTLNKSLDEYTAKLKNNEITQKEFNDQNFGQRVKDIGSDIQVASNNMDSLTKTILTNAKAFAQWYLLGGVISGVVQSLKNGITTVEDLNKSWVNLQIAMGGTSEQTNELIQSYSKLGESIGATTEEVASSGDTFLRQGKSVADANTLIQDSLILSKVGMISSADSTTYLTSAMKGYGVETSNVLGIVDKLTSVDMKSAVNAGGLAEAMSRTANMAQLAGVSMDKLIGYLATVGEVTQKDMSEVGTSFKFGTVAA